MAAQGVTANQVTLSALGLSLLVGALWLIFGAVRWALFLVPLVLFVRMALNAIDGMLAREHNQKTALGALLNELGDVVSDAAIYLPLSMVPQMPAGMLSLVVLLGVISEMTGVVAVQIGASRRYDGPMGKSDRALVFGVVAFLLGAGVAPGPWLQVVMVAMVVLLFITIGRRAVNALKELS